jgi:small subunit ribosomal protein S8
MMTDPIADLLTRIRNALRVRREVVEVPTSRLKREMVRVLKEEGYIWDYEEQQPEGAPRPRLRIYLKYDLHGEPVIRSIQRISKPGRRVYAKVEDLKPVLEGLGIRILSTNKGVLSDRQARKWRVGGEVLCEAW